MADRRRNESSTVGPFSRSLQTNPGDSRGWRGLFRWRRKPKLAFTARSRSGHGASDVLVAGLGITLGLTCALFPWYIFFNQEKFGIRALQFEGNDTENTGTITLSPQPERVGAPVAEIPPTQLDLLATGTLPPRNRDENQSGVGLTEQPFPMPDANFRLVHVANGRAMIEDDTGLFIVQRGSTLPDNSRVAAIEQRDGQWVLVTTGDQVVELTP